MSVTSIEWTEQSWNPVTGCQKVSPGCKHCYAARFAERFRGVKGHHYEQGFDLRLWRNRLAVPRQRRQPTMYFVNSMSDLFWESIPHDFLIDICEVMRTASHHTYQVLSKRANRMAEFLKTFPEYASLQNVWWGVSVENCQQGLPRVDLLRGTPAVVKWLSCEPLLEHLGTINLDGIRWVVVGGESGPHSRPMDPDWVRSIRDQCQAAKVPFFFKQWGGNSKKKTGRILDGHTWDAMPNQIRIPSAMRSPQQMNAQAK